MRFPEIYYPVLYYRHCDYEISGHGHINENNKLIFPINLL